MRSKLIALAALVASAAPAQAAVVLSDNFDAENGGATALNYTGFTNFTVEGNVDLVANGSFGIGCSGLCVDLDGSSGPGALVSKIFGYVDGDTYTFTFSIGGNQRAPGSVDEVYLSLFDGVTNALIITGSNLIDWDAPFLTAISDYTFAGSGTFYFKIGTSSADNQGPLVDNVVVEVTSAIPEPATWAMMIGGFGLVGASMRRRKVSVRFA